MFPYNAHQSSKAHQYFQVQEFQIDSKLEHLWQTEKSLSCRTDSESDASNDFLVRNSYGMVFEAVLHVCFSIFSIPFATELLQ